jgi:hypothetical protein
VIRVKSWEEFKRLVNEQKPSSVVYVIEQSGLSPNRELTSLRLMFPSSKAYYVFFGFCERRKAERNAYPIEQI